MTGCLYIVGLPIGNADDIGNRALGILSKTEHIYAEDTRSLQNLFSVFTRKYPQFDFSHAIIRSCFQENQLARIEEISDLLAQGTDVCLLSEAGMPGVSDPGALVVDYCRRKGASIEVIPGPSALTSIMAVSGFEAKTTVFMGYVPKRSKWLDKAVEASRDGFELPLCIVFFESAHRIKKTLMLLTSLDVRVCIACNLTKKGEIVWVGNTKLLHVSEFPEKGEYTCAMLISK